MGITTVAHPTNGTKPLHGIRPFGRIVPLLGPRIDHLLELRNLIRQAEAEERTMTREIVTGLQALGLSRPAGHQAVAILEERTTLTVDPELFHEALGVWAFEAMHVSVTAARKLLGENDLQAISEATTTPILRVEPLEAPVTPTRAA